MKLFAFVEYRHRWFRTGSFSWIDQGGNTIGEMSRAPAFITSKTGEFIYRGYRFSVQEKRIGKPEQSFSLGRAPRCFRFVCDSKGNRLMICRENHIKSHGSRFRLAYSENVWRLIDKRGDDIAVFTRTEYKEGASGEAVISILADEYELLVVSTFFAVIHDILVPIPSAGASGGG